MVTFSTKILMNKEADPPEYYCEGDCLSTDEKPTHGMFNGSFLLEMDTSKAAKFDQAAQEWKYL